MIFGKKKEDKPKTAYRISVLSTDYLIDGYNIPDYPIFEAAFDTDFENPLNNSLELKDARVQPVGDLDLPARAFDLWRIPSMLNVVAAFSDDPAAEDDLLSNWEDFQTPFKVIICAGVFEVEGTIFSSDEDAPPDFSLHLFAPMEI